jgi:hypothetical protein
MFTATTADNDAASIMPGELRVTDVSVGRHVAPAAVALPSLLSLFDEVDSRERPASDQLVAIAAAHHRTA